MVHLNRGGFSLSEVLISIAVISIGMLGLMSAMLFGTKASSHAQRSSQAANYAREIIEFIRMRDWAASPPTGLVDVSDATRKALGAAPLNGSTGATFTIPADANYTRNIQITPVAGLTDLYRIQVRVFFTATGGIDSGVGGVGSGFGSVERTVQLVALYGK